MRVFDGSDSLAGRATELAGLVYTRNAVGDIAAIIEAAGTRGLDYDSLRQLTGAGTEASPESYAYDAVGNRTASHLSATHTYARCFRALLPKE